MVTRMMIDTAIAALARHRPGVTDWHVAVGAALERAMAAAWVPCAERVPEPETAVMIAIADGAVGIGWIYEDRWFGFVGVESDASCLDKLHGEHVTHWMPLPAPPKA